MDADIQQQIRHEVVNAVAQSQNALMSQLKDLISNEMGKVQDQQQRIAETQITKIEATLSDGHKFKRRGNEEQFKHNKILSKIKEADNVLDANNPSQEGISKAKEKLAEGMSLLNYRQKIIKIADSSDLGWKVVQEYDTYLFTLLEIRTFLLPVTLYSTIEASAWFLSLCKFICCKCYKLLSIA
jgi:hypothetical protein